MNRRELLAAAAGGCLVPLSTRADATVMRHVPAIPPNWRTIAMEADAPQPDVNLSNWRQSPHNHRAFHHLPSEIATARVRSGSEGARFASSSKSIEAFSLRLPNGSSMGLEPFLAATSTDAMIVLHDGRLVNEVYRNSMEPDSRHIAMSATKAVIGLLTEILAADGAIKLDRPITDYVPEVANSPYAAAGARDLLDMRVAVLFDATQEQTYARAVGWEPPDHPNTDIRSFLSRLSGPAWACGGGFTYHSANTDLLGWVIEKATSAKVQDLLSEKLWAPIASDDAELTVDWDGFARSAGGLCATARDLARLGQVVCLDGSSGSAQIFPNHVVHGLAADGDRKAWSSGQWGESFAPISRGMSYRSGWYTVDTDPEILFAMGIHGQNLFVDRKNKIVMAKLSSWPQPVDGRTMWLTHAGFDEVRRRLQTS
ncbi:serine hydrolase domain-containing protein [Bradyrhizobium sp. CCBAU 21359]|uniref:serine hydrolase domain-containing protein n=1 Tax=Bradyrhizobium sp. CCBAU 21359 TaxID=1325080 RepID=UPI00230664B9|nr:serine hydrolase domain-containing protein [Bradyrhizobium sp. CCBAU 21359]